MKNLLSIVSMGMIAVSLSGCGLVHQAQQEQAAKEHQAAMKVASEESKAALQECHDKRVAGELKTYVESVKCSAPRIVEAFQKANYPYMDLISLANAKRLALAEKADKKKITEGEMQLKMAEAFTDMVNEERRRNLENIGAHNQITAAQAAQDQARAANMQVYSNMIQQGATMAQPPANNRIICTNNPMASGTMPNPTVCQSY